MGASEVDETVTVSGEGVTVRKEFVEDEFSVPTIRFLVENETDSGVQILLTEDLPESFSIDTVGFHPEYGSQYWTCFDDHRAEFDREVPPETEIETVYGVKIDDPDDADAFLTEPRLAVDGEEVTDRDDADGASPSESEVDKKILDDDESGGDDAGSDPSADADSSDDAGSDASLDVDVPEQRATDDEISLADPNDAAGNGHAAAVPGPETGTVVERLVEELRRNDVDADQKALLREQLDLGVPSETKARIERLSDRVETVAAYADALESFLDEDGTAQEVIRDFETQVEALREDVAGIREHTRSNAGDIGDLTADLGDLEAHVDDVEATVADLADQAEEIEDALASTDDDLADLAAELDDATDALEDNTRAIDELDADLTDVESDVTDLEAHLEDVEGRVTATEDDVDELETDVDALDEYVSEVEEGLDELREWRSELGEMFQ